MKRALLLYICAATAAGCGHHARPTGERVVALVVIDQLPEWGFDARLGAVHDGLGRLARDGRRFVARYPYAATSTSPGHAALGTGAPPSVTGIIGNELWDRGANVIVESTRDAHGVQGAELLRVDGIADALLRAHPGAHAVAVALKPRSALLSLGHHGVAVWYDADQQKMISNAPAPWLEDLAAAHPIAPMLAATWEPIDRARLATLSGGPDDAPGELPPHGWTSSFPHRLADARAPRKAFEATPFADGAVADAAVAAIAGEHLGQGDDPDLLIVSFSAYDYVGHAFGPDSWESWDTWLRLDAQLGEVERALDEQVGAGNWTMIVTSDHGVPSTPEHRRALGLPGLHLAYEDVADAAERGAESALGPPPGGAQWIAASRYPTVWLSAAARALPDAKRAALVDAAIAAVAAMPGIARAARTAELTGGCDARDGDDRLLCLSLDAERSGEIVYVPAPGTEMSKRSDADAADHGSPYGYDREVPLFVLGRGVTPGVVGEAVSPLQVAPTLAALLGVPPPPAARERPLPLL